jgi:catalase
VQGIQCLSNAEGAKLAGTDPDHHKLDLQNAIKRGDYPSWDVYVQTCKPEALSNAPCDLFDMTKVWPKKQYPLRKMGRVTLNKNPDNWFVDVEQLAFSPSNMVPGIAPSPDAMLQARMFAYPDAQRYRLGVNYNYLPTNAPKSQVYCPIERDGKMNFTANNGVDPNYIGTSLKPVHFMEKLSQSKPTKTTETNGAVGGKRSLDHVQTTMPSSVYTEVTDADFEQARALWKLMADQEGAHQRFIDNAAAHISGATHKSLRTRAYGMPAKLVRSCR